MTVVGKDGISSQVESFSDQFVPLEERKMNHEIRYAAFGSSVTWGSNLSDPKELTYIGRLTYGDSDRGTNFGIRSSGPNYLAACLYTLMEDQEFDIIILEFYMRNREGLLTLTRDCVNDAQVRSSS